MRYPASEKVEIIELVEQSHLPAKRTLDKLGIPRATTVHRRHNMVGQMLHEHATTLSAAPI
jgi:hypothetical protein